MAQAYGDDSRRKFLSAYDQGDETLEEPAGRFSGERGLGEEDIGSTEAHWAG